MKCFLTFLTLIAVSFSWTQQSYYGLERQADFISTFNEGKNIVATDGGTIKIWDASSGKVTSSLTIDDSYKKVEINAETYSCMGGIGSAQINADKTTLGMVGTKYYPSGSGDPIGTILILTDLSSMDHHFVAIPSKDEVLRFKFHPTNKNLVGLIIMDMDKFEYYSCIFDLEKQAIVQKYLIGKGSLIPLFIDFSTDGSQTVVSYGNSSYNGGIDIYETESAKLIKKIPLKEQPKSFFFTEDLLIAGGHSSTLLIDRKSWKINHTEKGISLITFDPETGIGWGHKLEKDDAELGIIAKYNVPEKTLKLISVDKAVRPFICKESKSIYAIYHKNYRNKEEQTLTNPTILNLNL